MVLKFKDTAGVTSSCQVDSSSLCQVKPGNSTAVCSVSYRSPGRWGSQGRRWDRIACLASPCSLPGRPLCVHGSCWPINLFLSSHVYLWAAKYYNAFTVHLLTRNGAPLKSLYTRLSLSIPVRTILWMGSYFQYFLKFLSLQPLDSAFAGIVTSFLLFWYQYLIQSTCHTVFPIPKTLIWDEREKRLAMYLQQQS